MPAEVDEATWEKLRGDCEVRAFMAWEAHGREGDLDDLLSEATYAVLKAIQRHDPEKAQLRTYANHLIAGALMHYYRSHYREKRRVALVIGVCKNYVSVLHHAVLTSEDGDQCLAPTSTST